MVIEIRPPSGWPAEVLAGFEALVRDGCEVAFDGLRGRIADARALACHFESGRLAAIAGVKNPRRTHREKLITRTGFRLTDSDYPYEVGWVYVAEGLRGRGMSRPLVDACLRSENSTGFFATVREANAPMQRTLERCGFVRAGRPYKSVRDVPLVLFVRDAVGS